MPSPSSVAAPSVAAATARPAAPNPDIQRSLEGSIPVALLNFAAPSLVQILVQNAVAAVEILFLSRLGTDPLAGISAVSPLVSLVIGMTTVGMGGAVSSAIAQSLGARKFLEAEALAMHAVLLSLVFGGISAVILIGLGPEIYHTLGARGRSLEEALAYSNIVFGGSVSMWLLGSLTGILRGMGDMRSAAWITVLRAVAVLPLFIILVFGWAPIPGFGMVGAAAAMLTYYALGVIGMVAYLQTERSVVHLRLSGFRPKWQLFHRILKVASPSSVQILVNGFALIAITTFVARFGVEALAGYGLASRLELLISSLVLAFGVGTTTMVGVCVGAGLVDRARRVTFVSCILAAAVFGVLGLGVSLSGRWIAEQFTHAEKVVLAASRYFHVTGLVYGFTAVSVMLFSAYQGWGRAAVPLWVSLLRVAVVLLGGWILLQQPDPQLDWLYYMVACATVLAASTLALMFAFRPPDPTRKAR
jgi:putative MATE family efflux protein